MELEALEAIWPTEFKPLPEDDPAPAGWPMEPTLYVVDLSPAQEGEDPEDYDERMEMVFQHTATYPEEAPRLRLRSVKGLNDKDLAHVQRMVSSGAADLCRKGRRRQSMRRYCVLRRIDVWSCAVVPSWQVEGLVDENLGMAMIYTLAEAAKEWLRDKAHVEVVEEVDPEELKQRAIEEEEKRKAEERRLGTPCTPESFQAWKEKFDAIKALERAKEPDLVTKQEKDKKMTGKQYFLQTDASKIAADQGELELDEDDFDFDDDDDDGMLDELEAELQAGG